MARKSGGVDNPISDKTRNEKWPSKKDVAEILGGSVRQADLIAQLGISAQQVINGLASDNPMANKLWQMARADAITLKNSLGDLWRILPSRSSVMDINACVLKCQRELQVAGIHQNHWPMTCGIGTFSEKGFYGEGEKGRKILADMGLDDGPMLDLLKDRENELARQLRHDTDSDGVITYDVTQQGIGQLRQAIISRLELLGVTTEKKEVMVTSGGSSGLNLSLRGHAQLAKQDGKTPVFIYPELCFNQAPDIHAVAAGMVRCSIPTTLADSHTPTAAGLQAALEKCLRDNAAEGLRIDQISPIFYLTHHTPPTSTDLSLDLLAETLEAAQNLFGDNLVILSDNAYVGMGDIDHERQLAAMIHAGGCKVIDVGSTSKIFAEPSRRVGWLSSNWPELMALMPSLSLHIGNVGVSTQAQLSALACLEVLPTENLQAFYNHLRQRQAKVMEIVSQANQRRAQSKLPLLNEGSPQASNPLYVWYELHPEVSWLEFCKATNLVGLPVPFAEGRKTGVRISVGAAPLLGENTN